MGKVLPHHFIEASTKINMAEYLRIQEEVILPWIKNYASLGNHPDSAPARGSEKVQTFLKRELPRLIIASNVWPSSLSDLNHCDLWFLELY